MSDQDRQDSQKAEAEFKRRLLELGLLSRITPPPAAGARQRPRAAVPVSGNAVSETVIRERR
jgi:hypothetical protein